MFRGSEGFVLGFSAASLEFRRLVWHQRDAGGDLGCFSGGKRKCRVMGVRVLLFHQEKSSLVHRDTFQRMVYGVLKVLCFLGLRSLSSWAKG